MLSTSKWTGAAVELACAESGLLCSGEPDSSRERSSGNLILCQLLMESIRILSFFQPLVEKKDCLIEMFSPWLEVVKY